MGRVGIVLVGLILGGWSSNGADYAKIGTLQRDGHWEIGVTFDPLIDLDSTLLQDQYQVEGRELSGARHVAQDGAMVLSTADLEGGGTCNITDLKRTDGSAVPLVSLAVEPTDFTWVAIGSQELGFTPEAVAVGTNGFDLISGGYQLYENYDEATFVYEPLTGDFDKHVRVEYQDPSSRWARAGLMVRETLDAGRPRPSDPFDLTEAFSRYLEVHVTPQETAYGDPASNMYEINFRPFTGGINSPEFAATENPVITNNAAPTYPNAWMRIKRVGQVFTVYRGEDGTHWFQIGTFTFPTKDVNGDSVPAFPATVYVGPSYSPENGNIPVNTGARAAFLAKFRDYGGSGSNAGGGTLGALQITKAGGVVQISWQGTAMLQSNSNLKTNQWNDLPAASSPYKIQPAGKAVFYRLKG